jgi:hypothetical protein
MISNSPRTDELFATEKSSSGPKVLAVICALAIAGLLLGGYAFLRRRHAASNVMRPAPVAESKSTTPKGPAKVHVLIDDPMLKSGETIIGGTVKNISNDNLNGLSVELELWRRKDGTADQKSITLDPATLAPSQEGKYSIKFAAQEYASVRLIGVKENNSTLLAHSSGQGERRPMEKTESKTVVVGGKRNPSKDEFINTPDNPGRVP